MENSKKFLDLAGLQRYTQHLQTLLSGKLDNAIVEVTELPTEAIKENIFYRVTDQDHSLYTHRNGVWVKYATQADLAKKQDVLMFDGEYNEETNKVATVQTVTAALSEAQAFATEAVDNLAKNIYTKSETYTKEEVLEHLEHFAWWEF